MKRKIPISWESTGLFGLLLLTFGIFIPWLGFYWDDFPILLASRMNGAAGQWQYWQYDRPFGTWTFIFTRSFLGENPAAWQSFTLLMRWLTTVTMWKTVTAIWPCHRREATWAALLFAVYPVFTQQAISVAYSQHWICYFLYFLSLLMMVLAWRHPGKFWQLTALSLILSLVQMFTMEYFVGLELLRPAVLWVLAAEQPSNLWQRLKKVIILWLPYLAALTIFVLWRLVFLELPVEDDNAPALLYQFLASPWSGFLRLLQIATQDTVYLLSLSWANTLAPESIDFADRFTLLAWGISFLIALLTGYLLLKQHKTLPALEPPAAWPWGYQAALLGVTGILVGTTTSWITDRQIITGMFSDRFGLPSMFGASLAVVGITNILIAERKKQIIVLSILTALAAGYLIRGANDFRWARIQQNRFFWQLYWRAPAIEPQTAVLAYAEVLPKTGLYSTAAGINLIYADPSPSGELPYWFFSISRDFGHRMYDLLNRSQLTETFRQFTFSGSSRDSLIVYYEPRDADCLRIVSPKDVDDPALQPLVAKVAPVANLSRIRPEARPGRAPDAQIFGPEPEHGWCYFFQKADLAAQLDDWQQVVELGEAAREQGYSLANSQSNTPQEWLPFIEGYAMTGDWEEARVITQAVLEREPKMAGRLCEAWEDLRDLADQSGAELSKAVIAEIGCQ